MPREASRPRRAGVALWLLACATSLPVRGESAATTSTQTKPTAPPTAPAPTRPTPPPGAPAPRASSAGVARPAPPQTPASPQLVVRGTAEAPEATFQDEAVVSWILVPVTVKNRRGHVRGLERDDFELRVDGKPTRFDDFEARGEVPWSIVFLQDLSGSMELSRKLELSKKAIGSFLDQSRPGDEFALASFAGDITAIDVPFTENQRPLRETLERWEAYGRTALHDAVSLLPQISGDSRNVKRAVVLITDGADNASRIPPNQAREVVRRAQLPVYVLGLDSGDPFAVSAEGEKLSRYADVLNLLAQSTGGRYLAVDGAEELQQACTSIAEELRWQYVLGFETVASGQNQFRPISVTVKKSGVDVAFRRGYRGLPPRP